MSKHTVFFKIGTKGISIILFLLGLLCVIFSFVEFEHPWSWWQTWGKNVSNTVGTTLMASCVISLILEISNINSIFQNILGNILGDDFPLEAYSENNLEEFKYKICVHQCKDGMKKEQLVNGIYKYEKKLLELSNGLYYDYHNVKYVIEPNELEGIFKVHAAIEYKIVNKFGDDNEMRFKIRTYTISDAEPQKDYENNFLLEKFEVNGEIISNPEICIEKIDKETDSNFYDYKVKIKKNFGKQKNVTVKMAYAYNMPITDQIQSYKITLPCKRLEHQIKIKSDVITKDAWEVKTNAFTAFYYRQKDDDCKFKVEQSGSDLTRIRYDDWIIPGGGYVLYFGKK